MIEVGDYLNHHVDAMGVMAMSSSLRMSFFHMMTMRLERQIAADWIWESNFKTSVSLLCSLSRVSKSTSIQGLWSLTIASHWSLNLALLAPLTFQMMKFIGDDCDGDWSMGLFPFLTWGDLCRSIIGFSVRLLECFPFRFSGSLGKAKDLLGSVPT